MAPGTRLKKNKGLPDNLYTNEIKGKTYFRYKHPITKKMHSLGCDKSQAVTAARVLNNRLYREPDLVKAILAPTDITLFDLIEDYKKYHLPTLELEDSSRGHYLRRLDRFAKDKPNWSVANTDTGEIAEYLDKNFKNDAYIKHRGMLKKLFQYSQTKGYRKDNPVEPTFSKSSVKKKRQRLKLEEFQAIHEIAPDWMKIAMELSLLTLQGRHEICNMKFSDIKNDYIHVIRQKTKKNEWAHLRIKMNPALEALVFRSRKSGILSPYVIHHNPKRRTKAKDKDHWTQFSLNDFTSRFRELRDSTGLFDKVERDKRPTFHEIRALGSWLYKKQGFDQGDYVQRLMAHADEKMTEVYQAGHEQQWMDVAADLNINVALTTSKGY